MRILTIKQQYLLIVDQLKQIAEVFYYSAQYKLMKL